ncbi:hypothetical protein TNCV_4232701 [Trichonephila clavipes]|nr:hypothetical protein TNCV_4232701 [Trichonephila clavipes]
MTVSLILEGMFYFLPFILAILTQGNLPNLIQILTYATIAEFLKHYLLLQHGAKPDSHMKSLPPNLKQPKIAKKNIPLVHSLMVFKICEALDIQVKFAPIEKQKYDFKICEGDKSSFPAVQSEKLCKELNIRVNFSLEKHSNNLTPQVASTNIKPPITVNSLMVHKMSQALGFDTELNPVKHPEPFVSNLRKKRLAKKIPTVNSPEIFKFCEALEIQAKLISP